jgi:hypothetical protein
MPQVIAAIHISLNTRGFEYKRLESSQRMVFNRDSPMRFSLNALYLLTFMHGLVMDQ